MDTSILEQIYATLSLIETKGENTMRMAACLDALRNVITNCLNEQTEDKSNMAQ